MASKTVPMPPIPMMRLMVYWPTVTPSMVSCWDARYIILESWAVLMSSVHGGSFSGT